MLKKNARGITVAAAISKDFATIKQNASIQQIYSTIKKKKKHMLITRANGTYAFVNILDRKRLSTASTAADLAIPLPSIPKNMNIVDAMSTLENKEAGLAAVVSNNKLIGVVTAQHLEAFIALHIAQKAKQNKRK